MPLAYLYTYALYTITNATNVPYRAQSFLIITNMLVLAFDRNHVLLNLIKCSLLICHTLEHAKVPSCITKRSMHHHSCFLGSDLPMISDLLRAPCRVASPCASPETRLLPSESQRHSEGRKKMAGRVKHLVQLVQLNLKLGYIYKFP